MAIHERPGASETSLRKLAYVWRVNVIRKGARAFHKELARAERMSPDQLAKLNLERKKAIVRYAYEHVPFYRRFYDEAGVSPDQIRSNADFAKLPILERHHLETEFHRLISEEYKGLNLEEASTGGTTGTPVKVLRDPRYPLELISWRALARWGVNPWDNAAYLYRGIPSKVGGIARNVVYFPTRRGYLSAFEMNDRSMDKFARWIVSHEPSYLVGYVGALEIFAEYIERNPLHLPDITAVWSTAAPLPDVTRNRLEKTFGCPVYSQYGSCEFYAIACECQARSGLHIDSDIRNVEVVNPEGAPCQPKEFGDLIVSDLINCAFPLIRYRTGDRGRLLGRCSCGAPFPLMDYVRGRVSDVIALKNGDKIPGEFWTTIFDDYPEEVTTFSVHQDEDYRIHVYYQRTGNSDGVISEVRNRLAARVGGEDELVFVNGTNSDVVGGKKRFVTSDVTSRTN